MSSVWRWLRASGVEDATLAELKKKILYISLCQSGLLVCGLVNGFLVYETSPAPSLRISREWDRGGVGVLEPLGRSNIIALAGGGKSPMGPKNQMRIWDDQKGTFLASVDFDGRIRSIKLTRDRICVCTKDYVFVLSFRTLEVLSRFRVRAGASPTPAFAMSSLPGTAAVAYALAEEEGDTSKSGKVIFRNLLAEPDIAPAGGLQIVAHNAPVYALALSDDGQLCATASETGLLVRVWDTATGALKFELRRGSDAAVINSLHFSAHHRWLCVCSSRGTVHVFGLRREDVPTASSPRDEDDVGSERAHECDERKAEEEDEDGEQQQRAAPRRSMDVARPAVVVRKKHQRPAEAPVKASQSWLHGLGSVHKYFDSKWSFVHFHIPFFDAQAAFDMNDAVNVVARDGTLLKYEFPEKGGEAREVFKGNILEAKKKEQAAEDS